MKKLAFISAFLMVAFSGLIAQENGELFTAEIKKGELPKDILKAIEKDFPTMIAKQFKAIPGEFINGTFVLNNNETPNNDQTYQIFLEANGFEANALYDAQGHLISAKEHWKNKPLPEAVSRAIGQMYPGWTLGSDYEKISINQNDNLHPYYRIQLKKGHEKTRVTLDEYGKEIGKQSTNTM
ncbi:MAG: hypothetical protein KDC59_11905 [Saprospiraceae bacterium]|nr:hypothetical protein [Saprospiraceae bacterium]